VHKYMAEALGTFVLVFCGVGSAVLAGREIGLLGVALAVGFSVLAMIYAIGPVSGCHINPAVTFGMYVARRLPARDVAGYIIAQVLGAILAAGLLLLIAEGARGDYDPTVTGFGANGYGDYSPGRYNLLSVFLVETIMTGILVFTVLSATDPKAPAGFAGIAIGLVLTLLVLAGGVVSNASYNPARSIGPAIFVGGQATIQLWVFIIAPLIGAFLAAIVYRTIHLPGMTFEKGANQARIAETDRPVRDVVASDSAETMTNQTRVEDETVIR
jgi:aquaporin Z